VHSAHRTRSSLLRAALACALSLGSLDFYEKMQTAQCKKVKRVHDCGSHQKVCVCVCNGSISCLLPREWCSFRKGRRLVAQIWNCTWWNCTRGRICCNDLQSNRAICMPVMYLCMICHGFNKCCARHTQTQIACLSLFVSAYGSDMRTEEPTHT